MTTLNEVFAWFITFINETLVPLVFALAFLLFLFGVFKYFFTSGAKAEENRREGRSYILWAVIGFAVMICIWGLVNLVANTVPGLDSQSRPCIPTFGNPDCPDGGNSTGNNSNGGVLPPVGDDEGSLGTQLQFPNEAQ